MPSFSEQPCFFQQFTTNTFLSVYVQNFICQIQSINLHIYINAHFSFVETILIYLRHELQRFQMFLFPSSDFCENIQHVYSIVKIRLILRENGIWLVLQHATIPTVWGKWSTFHFIKSIKWWMLHIILNKYYYLKVDSFYWQFDF